MRIAAVLIKVVLAVGLMAAATPAVAHLPVDPFSRWTPRAMEGAARLNAGGPNGATVVLLRRSHGPSSTAPFDPSKVVVTKVGTATISFRPAGDAVLESAAFGRSETRTITRQPF